MATVVNAYVHLRKKDGTAVVLAPGDAVPAWAKSKVGAHALAEVSAEKTAEQQQPEVPSKPASTDGVTPDGEKAIAELQAKLEEIGQPTDGDLEELQKRLAEHGE
jgi:hypothetical protein